VHAVLAKWDKIAREYIMQAKKKAWERFIQWQCRQRENECQTTARRSPPPKHHPCLTADQWCHQGRVALRWSETLLASRSTHRGRRTDTSHDDQNTWTWADNATTFTSMTTDQWHDCSRAEGATPRFPRVEQAQYNRTRKHFMTNDH